MRINAIMSNYPVLNTLKSGEVYKKQKFENVSDQVSFKNYHPASVEKYLHSRYKMDCKLRNNYLIAECVKKTTLLFDKIFGSNSLPNIVNYVPFHKKFRDYNMESVTGLHTASVNSSQNEVYFNLDQRCFQTRNKLKFDEMVNKVLWWHPTGHYLQTFVHEFGHSAHFKNLYNRGNTHVMWALSDTKIPTFLGRFLAKCKLGRYSATDMNEFMAERITKDVCKNLNSQDNFV